MGVLIKPHSSAKASTSSVESVLNSLEYTLRPCKAIAVKLDSQSLVSKSDSVLPLLTRYFLNHVSLAWAWLTSFLATGPIVFRCDDYIEAVRAAIKMILPFDFSERVYGAVCASSDGH